MEKFLRYLGIIGALAAGFMSTLPEGLRWLLLIMAIDVVLGTLRAIHQGRLSSESAWGGMVKKIGTLGVIALVNIIQNGMHMAYFVGYDLATFVTGYFIWSESLSVVENAAGLGVKLPDVIIKALDQLSPDKKIPNPGPLPPGMGRSG